MIVGGPPRVPPRLPCSSRTLGVRSSCLVDGNAVHEQGTPGIHHRLQKNIATGEIHNPRTRCLHARSVASHDLRAAERTPAALRRPAGPNVRSSDRVVSGLRRGEQQSTGQHVGIKLLKRPTSSHYSSIGILLTRRTRRVSEVGRGRMSPLSKSTTQANSVVTFAAVCNGVADQ